MSYSILIHQIYTITFRTVGHRRIFRCLQHWKNTKASLTCEVHKNYVLEVYLQRKHVIQSFFISASSEINRITIWKFVHLRTFQLYIVFEFLDEMHEFVKCLYRNRVSHHKRFNKPDGGFCYLTEGKKYFEKYH